MGPLTPAPVGSGSLSRSLRFPGLSGFSGFGAPLQPNLLAYPNYYLENNQGIVPALGDRAIFTNLWFFLAILRGHRGSVSPAHHHVHEASGSSLGVCLSSRH